MFFYCFQQQGANGNQYYSATINQEVVKAVLERSFMKPLKGSNKEHCQMGHKLELPIALDWIKDVNENHAFPGFNFTIISLHKVGLVGKKGCPWAKDSLDFLGLIHNEEKDSIELWGVEIKSRQTVMTINKEKEFMRKLRRQKYEKINACEVAKHIQKLDERWQMLHHAYVYGLGRVVHIVGTTGGKVISGTVVDYDNNLLHEYGKVLKDLKNVALFWAYQTTTIIPDNVIELADEISSINGKETLFETFKLWKTMFSDTSILPRPALKRIIPSTHASWNVTKGGSDTITKCVDDCFIKPPRQHTNFESVATARSLSNLLVTGLKLYQITTSKQDLKNSYKSIQHFRNASSQRFTFKKILRMMYTVFRKEGEMITNAAMRLVYNDDNNENEQPGQVQNPQQQATNRRPRRVRFHRTSLTPEPMGFATIKTGHTPLRNKRKQVLTGAVNDQIAERTIHCTGFPFEIICQDEAKQKANNSKTLDSRRRCYICNTKTKWQCLKCKFYFCMTVNKAAARKRQLYQENSNNNTTRIIGKSCFHVGHEKAMNDAMNSGN